MDVGEVQGRVERIRKLAGDGESAHAEEDALHRDVLSSIATGCSNGPELARIALETREIDFVRWYA